MKTPVLFGCVSAVAGSLWAGGNGGWQDMPYSMPAMKRRNGEYHGKKFERTHQWHTRKTQVGRIMTRLLIISALVLIAYRAAAILPEFTVTERGLDVARISPDCPIIYDNDFWTDVPDAAYMWAKASLGEANLKGNVVTRCTFGWEKKYAHSLEQSVAEAQKLMRLAKESGLRNVPEPVIGSTVALRKPASGNVEDTQFERTAGSALILAEAKKATPQKPLLVFVGGSCTTIASAYLTDPTITNRVIVFQIDGRGYNGSDQWAWDIAMNRFVFANWARGYFWKEVSTWPIERFHELPKNPLCDWLREHAKSGLGKANQWGDGAWIFYTFDRRCLTKAVLWDNQALTIPREGTNAKAMEDEFFRTLKNAAVYDQN